MSIKIRLVMTVLGLSLLGGCLFHQAEQVQAGERAHKLRFGEPKGDHGPAGGH